MGDKPQFIKLIGVYERDRPGKPPKDLTFNSKILRSLRRRHGLTQEKFAEMCEQSC